MVKSKSKKFILWFNEINKNDVGLVGGKNASLGEMYQSLTSTGHSGSKRAKELMKQWGAIRVPNGFAITSYAYRYFIKQAGLEKEIRSMLKGLNTHDVRDLARRGALVRKTILTAEIPEEIKDEIRHHYKNLSREFKRATLT
jgi:pyruvate, water dikinase